MALGPPKALLIAHFRGGFAPPYAPLAHPLTHLACMLLWDRQNCLPLDFSLAFFTQTKVME